MSAAHREAQDHVDAHLLIQQVGITARIARLGLSQGLLDPVWIERRLTRDRGRALPKIVHQMVSTVDRRTDEIIAAIGLPPNKRQDTLFAHFEEDCIRSGAEFYDLILLRSLLETSLAVREAFQKALHGLGLPIIFAHQLYELAYGWSEAVATLPRQASPSDEELQVVWCQLGEMLEGYVEHDDSDPDGEGDLYIGGIGQFGDFIYHARALCASIAAWKSVPGRVSRAAERRWTRMTQRLIELQPAVKAWEFYEHSEIGDSRPFEEAFIIGHSPQDESLAARYFEAQNDGSGEIPALNFMLDDDRSVTRAVLFPKLCSAVMSLLLQAERGRSAS